MDGFQRHFDSQLLAYGKQTILNLVRTLPGPHSSAVRTPEVSLDQGCRLTWTWKRFASADKKRSVFFREIPVWFVCSYVCLTELISFALVPPAALSLLLKSMSVFRGG